MSNYTALAFRMLRYRVALMLFLFFLLGLAGHVSLTVFSFQYVFAAICLCASYIAATTVNDIADEKIDALNHPHMRGRPLITGKATKKDLIFLHIFFSACALFFAAFINPIAVILILFSLLINYLYSLPPLQLSHKPYFAPLILAFAYVVLPYTLALAVAGRSVQKNDIVFIASFVLLFLGRILLKDFRDRKGDAAYGKKTFLLTHGKNVTCVTSGIAIFIGSILFCIAFPIKNSLAITDILLYFCTIYYAGYTLYRAKTHESEQIAIGIGAKMGNGLLIALLGLLVVRGSLATESDQIMIFLTICILFLINFFLLIRNPRYAVIGYRG